MHGFSSYYIFWYPLVNKDENEDKLNDCYGDLLPGSWIVQQCYHGNKTALQITIFSFYLSMNINSYIWKKNQNCCFSLATYIIYLKNEICCYGNNN